MTSKERQQRRKRRMKRRSAEPATILTYDDMKPTVCRPAVETDMGVVRTLVATLTKAESKDSLGVGLAAPQIGVDVRIVVVWPDRGKGGFPMAMVNPQVLAHSATTASGMEGCLSYPGLQAEVLRSNLILVSYHDEWMRKTCRQFDGFAARVIQHELDHLDGVCRVYNNGKENE